MGLWVGGVGSCLAAALLYLCQRNCEKEAEVLKSVIRVNQSSDLDQLLDSSSKVSSSVVSISGKVRSETPIKCKYSDRRGVIVEETAELHFLKKNDKGIWSRERQLMQSTCKVVPWYLDVGTSRVYVPRAQGATDLAFGVGSEVFEKSKPGNLKDLQILGIKRVEKILPTGTRLTVVGEASKDKIGRIKIEKPQYVTHGTIDQIIADCGDSAWCLKFFSGGLAVLGASLIAMNAYQTIMERVRIWKLRRRSKKNKKKEKRPKMTIHPCSALAAAVERSLEENEDENSENRLDSRMPSLCVICLEQETDCVIAPCGHMCCCMACSSRLPHCPLCRQPMEQVLRVFRN